MKNWITVCMFVKEWLHVKDVGAQVLVMMVRPTEFIIIMGFIMRFFLHFVSLHRYNIRFPYIRLPLPLLRYLGFKIFDVPLILFNSN